MVRGYQPGAGWPSAPTWFGNPAGVESSGGQLALFEEARRFFSDLAMHQPVLVILEDLHWADPASLDVLRYLGRQLSDERILLTATYREDEIDRDHRLYQLLPLLVRESQPQRLHLGRLDRGAIQELVASRYVLAEDESSQLVDYLWERSEGNPFFIGEILHGLEDERVLRIVADGWRLDDLQRASIPLLLRQALDARLERLPPETRSALQVAAVIGQDVPLDLWQTAAGLDDEQLDRVIVAALEARLLEEAPDAALRFRHALLREALYQSLLVTRRRAVHRQLGEALARIPGSQLDAVAHHFQQAGDARALEWLLRAGLRARQSAAWFTAAERFEDAAAMLEHDPSQVRLRAWTLFWVVFLRRYSRSPRSAGYLDEVERLAQIANDPLLPAQLRHIHGARLGFRGEIRRAIEDMEAAAMIFDEVTRTHPAPPMDVMAAAVIEEWLSTHGVQPYPRSDPPLELVDGTPRVSQQRGVLVIWLSHSGNYRRARQQGEMFIAQVTAAFGDRHLERGSCASGHAGLGHAYAALGFPDDAHRELTIAREAYAATGDYGMENFSAWLELLVVSIPYRADRIAEREALLTIAEQAWNRSIGMTMTVADPDHSRLLVDILEGRWSEARQRATEGLSAPGPDKHQSAVVNLGILARNQGEPNLAWQQVLALLPEEPETEPGDSWFAHSHAGQRLAAELALDANDLDLAGRWIEAHGRWQAWSGAVLWQPHHQLLQARYHQLSGDLDAARHHADRALALASDPRQPLALVAAHRLLGELATQDKRLAEAEDQLRESLSLAEACAAPYEQALTLLALAGVGAAAEKPDYAWRMIDRARAILTPLQALPALQRATAIAARLSVRRGQPVHPAGLTPREAEVLGLVARGLTDAEVAEQLFISPRTVGVHLTSVYNKLGVNSRVEATRFAVEQGLTGPS
jgi:DNA-binding CsgD family transcriptional regulator